MNDEIERRKAEPTPQQGVTAAPKAAARGGRGKKIGHGLVVASAAAVLAVYAAGYTATRSAAAQVAAQAAPPVASGPAATTSTATGITLPTATSMPSATATTAPLPNATAASATPMTAPSATATRAPAPTATSAPRATATRVPSATATSAPAPTATTAAAPAAAASAYKDGTYSGAGTSRHGSIQATVVVKNGRIVSAQITGSTTRYPTSRIAILPGEVLAEQGTTVNYVSGATDSSMAYLDAVANALAQAA